jgi:hypothetical protein
MKKTTWNCQEWIELLPQMDFCVLETLRYAILDETDVAPFKVGRNPYNGILVIKHYDLKMRLLIMHDYKRDYLLRIIDNKIDKVLEDV